MNTLFQKGIAHYNTPYEKQFIEENYETAENISIDYAILEKATNVYVLPATFDWNDLGTWGQLHDKLDKDEIITVSSMPKLYWKMHPITSFVQMPINL